MFPQGWVGAKQPTDVERTPDDLWTGIIPTTTTDDGRRTTDDGRRNGRSGTEQKTSLYSSSVVVVRYVRARREGDGSSASSRDPLLPSASPRFDFHPHRGSTRARAPPLDRPRANGRMKDFFRVVRRRVSLRITLPVATTRRRFARTLTPHRGCTIVDIGASFRIGVAVCRPFRGAATGRVGSRAPRRTRAFFVWARVLVNLLVDS